ncbi:HK97 gp10 family phage protein [Fictibacillus enclensis]|uniref:HK97-gp10 family putative phage morphogenesis protein n=1 Tax=Fictibacillus enclensis TaxID=1017270 RepID=UPI0025A096F2|nr:HK97-gp10 family putative phage morphogenesis protein [Fictibacillus enclensis]MDM5199253.1 HK97 gp10 family phage protein [Fictibacillus enclensis]
MAEKTGVEGFAQIDSTLKKLALQSKKASAKAAKAGGKVLAEALPDEMPYDPETKYHLRDDVQMSGVKNNGDIFVQVGFGNNTAWRVHITEWGTIYQPPQAVIQRTEKRTEKQIIEAMERAVMEALGL